MWKYVAVFVSLLLIPTALSRFAGNQLLGPVVEAGINSIIAVKGPNYQYKADLSRQIGKDIVEFIRSIIPSLKPKVDFAADVINDAVGATNGLILQGFENSNRTIIGMENFFTKMYQALILNVNDGKGALNKAKRQTKNVAERRETTNQ